MTRDQSNLADLMDDAYRALLALDDVAKRDSAKTTAAAVNNGRRVYSGLLDYQRTTWMSKAEADALQTTADLLRSRLRSLGEAA